MPDQRLIALSDALDLLERVAPRSWAKRMMQWMILDGEIELYSGDGQIVHKLYSYEIFERARKSEGASVGDAELRERWGDDILKEIEQAGLGNYVPFWRETWADDAIRIPEFLTIFLDFDFESNSARLDEVQFDDFVEDAVYGHDERFQRIEKHSWVEADLMSLGVLARQIEILVGSPRAPTPEMPHRAPPGRKRVHDWEGALIHVIAWANTYNGLPEGDGAQAALTREMQSWFIEQTDKAPADSELKLRARRILDAVQRRGRK